MRKLAIISSLFVLSACSQAEDAAPAEEAAPAEDLSAHVGAAIVTQADGTDLLYYSSADGKTYVAPLAKDYQPASWSVEGENSCISPPDAEKFCFTTSPADEAGAIVATGTDGNALGSFVPVNATVAAGTEWTPRAGAALVTPSDGAPFLSVWTTDGKSYEALEPQQGTWRAEDGKRCGIAPGETEEACSTPGPMKDDGTFEAVLDNGDKVTVRFLN